MTNLDKLSTKNLSPLPPPPEVMRRCQALAALDAIVRSGQPVVDFDVRWAPGVSAAFVDNKHGSRMSLFFADDGRALIKGCAADAFMSPTADAPFEPDCEERLVFYPGLLAGLPDNIKSLADERDGLDFISFVIWHEPGDPGWKRGDFEWPRDVIDPDGSEELLSIFVDEAKSIARWAIDLYHLPSLDTGAVAQLLSAKSMTPGLLKRFGCTRSIEALEGRFQQCGFVVAESEEASDSADARSAQREPGKAGSTKTSSAPPNDAALLGKLSDIANSGRTAFGKLIGAFGNGGSEKIPTAYDEPALIWSRSKYKELLRDRKSNLAEKLVNAERRFLTAYRASKEDALAQFVEKIETEFASDPDFVKRCYSELATTLANADRKTDSDWVSRRAEKFGSNIAD